MAEQEADYVYNGEAVRLSLMQRIRAKFDKGNLHPDAYNEKVPSPPLDDEVLEEDK